MNVVQLPALNTTKSLEAHQIESFRKNGHTLVKNVLDANEVAAYRDVINEAAYKYNTEKRKLEERDTTVKHFCKS